MTVDEGVLAPVTERQRGARKEKKSMHGYSLGAVKLRSILMAAAVLALMLVTLGIAGGVARSDTAPSTDLSLKATPDTLLLGKATELKGSLVHKNGDSVSGKRILLEQKVAGTPVWVPVPSMPDAGLLTNAGGEFSLAGVKPHNNTQYRARFIQGAQDYTSDAVPVNVKVRIPLNLSKNRVKEGNGTKISGSVNPGQATGKIQLTLQGNHKRVVKTINLDDSKFEYKFTPKKAGKYNVTAHFKNNESNLGNKSITRTLRVR
jgi:hypothetical protein